MYIEFLEGEEWRDVVGITGYKVSNRGRVVSFKINKNGELLTPVPDKDGYLRVTMINQGKAITKKIHRLVAEAFLDNPNRYEDVNHIDDDPTNNNVENLVWCTSAYNTAYRTDKTFKDYGYMHKITRPENLTESEKSIILDMYFNKYEDISKICDYLNITEYCARIIIHGSRKNYSEYIKNHKKIFSHIKEEKKVTQTRLSKAEILDVYNMVNNLGIAPREIMKKYNISKSAVSSIKRKAVHKDLFHECINPENNRIKIMKKVK